MRMISDFFYKITGMEKRKINALRQNLRAKTLHNEPLIDRLIDMEKRKNPKAGTVQLYEAAIKQWERDNR